MSTELHAWRGIPITELSREQLIEALRGAMRTNSRSAYEMPIDERYQGPVYSHDQWRRLWSATPPSHTAASPTSPDPCVNTTPASGERE